MGTPVLRKARATFFTPPEVTRFIADWAIRMGEDAVLKPSCGDAAFLLAATDRLPIRRFPRVSARQLIFRKRAMPAVFSPFVQLRFVQ